MSIHDVIGLATVLLLLVGVILGLCAIVMMIREENRKKQKLDEMIDYCRKSAKEAADNGDVFRQHNAVTEMKILKEAKKELFGE